MIHGPGFLISILAFVLVIGPLVFVHELGHYLVARWCSVKAEAFSIGFGREIAGWTDRRGTRWKLGWLPLGGYVRFAGDMSPAGGTDASWLALPSEERAQTFQAKALWQRTLIVAAGPVTNFIVAIVILAAFAFAFGDLRTPTTVGSVVTDSAAAAAGLEPGDRITAVGGRSFETFDQLARYVLMRPGDHVEVDFIRDGRDETRDVTLGRIEQVDRFGNHSAIGQLGVGATEPVVRPVGLVEAPLVGLRWAGEITRITIDGIGQIISGRRSLRDLNGPVGTARIAGEQMTLGPLAFIYLVAGISLNLGFINLLPIPMLDGGHLLFYAIEGVRRRPLEVQAQEWAFRGGLAALVALIVVVTVNDLGAFGLWKSLAGLIG